MRRRKTPEKPVCSELVSPVRSLIAKKDVGKFSPEARELAETSASTWRFHRGVSDSADEVAVGGVWCELVSTISSPIHTETVAASRLLPFTARGGELARNTCNSNPVLDHVIA